MAFMLSVPREVRKNQYLYKKILLRISPELFSQPLKNTLGLSAGAPWWRIMFRSALLKTSRHLFHRSPRYVPPGINYLDFKHALRHRTGFRELVYGCIKDLKQRNIVDWVDIDAIREEHLSKKQNHAQALLTLASLEIHLKAGLEL